MHVLSFVIVILCYRGTTAGTIVVQQTTNQRTDQFHNTNETVTTPQIRKFHVISDIKYRYARTVVSSRVVNPTNSSQEIFFSAVLPETAFVSGFLMEVDGHTYRAYVREKEAARQEYTEAVNQGRTAAHVALSFSARDSNHFRVSLNLESHKKVTFNLTYEELLSRKLGVYKQIINLDPGQIVQDFKVQVNIEESTDIVRLNVPALRTSNEIVVNPQTESTNPLATIERVNPRKVGVKFSPTPEEQTELARDGIKGQLIVEYDVDRVSKSGEILVNDGYFVHFFAPADLPSLKKQVTFVLDVSGSMLGHKIEQLKQAMSTILDDLHSGDLFSIVIFSGIVQVWDHTLSTSTQSEMLSASLTTMLWQTELVNHNLTHTVVAAATTSNINKAKEFIGELRAAGVTNIHGALTKALEITKLELQNISNTESNDIQQDGATQKPEPIIIFLTDGQANVGIRDSNTIATSISEMNTCNASIFSLALGNDADFNFLKQLSLRNSGFARKIYEASDTALQLGDFYRQVSSPLLAHVQFQYPPDQVDQMSITTRSFRRLFLGSELVVSGRLYDSNMTAEIQGTGSSGRSHYSFRPTLVPRSLQEFTETNGTNSLTLNTNATNAMERLWAYLTIQQLLDKDKEMGNGNTNGNSTEKQRALELALRYSFVTPLTSLVVVKPNGTSQVDTSESDGRQQPAPIALSIPGFGGTGTFISRSSSTLCSGCSRAHHPTMMRFLIEPRQISTPRFSFFRGPQMRRIMNHEPPTTTAPVPSIVGLDDIIWMPLYSNSTTIGLPTGSHDATEYYQLATANQTNEAYSNCTAPTGDPGHCRHLRYCVINVFIRYRSYYMPYFCRIGNFAGVCCPDNLIQPTLN